MGRKRQSFGTKMRGNGNDMGPSQEYSQEYSRGVEDPTPSWRGGGRFGKLHLQFPGLNFTQSVLTLLFAGRGLVRYLGQ